jgi:hypothetical protein
MGPIEAAVPQEFHPNKGIEKYIAISDSLSVCPSFYMSAVGDIIKYVAVSTVFKIGP